MAVVDNESSDVSKAQSTVAFSIIADSNVPEMLGRRASLALRGRPAIQTPSYIAVTSRGALPHVTHDILQQYTGVTAFYVALEDFIEKRVSNAPIFQPSTTITNESNRSTLRDFAAIPEKCLTILGPRRIPGVPCRQQNANDSIAISTSYGFSSLTVREYLTATKALQPDISISIADIVLSETRSRKRSEKSADRTHAWLRDTVEAKVAITDHETTALLGSIPPLEPEQQSFYLADLSNAFAHHLAGLCLSTTDSVTAIPQQLHHLPRICLSMPENPQDVLRAISLGIDLVTLPFVTTTSEAGIAFTFDLEAEKGADTANGSNRMPLGIDMWPQDHATALLPLKEGCTCYTCTRHHRAYLHHLLQAKEMLAWTLLQMHNFHVVDQFFAQIRNAIAQGTFQDQYSAFTRNYEDQIPQQTGQGPRVRGYQTKSTGRGEPKKNAKAYGRLEEYARKNQETDGVIAAPEVGSEQLDQQGFAEKL